MLLRIYDVGPLAGQGPISVIVVILSVITDRVCLGPVLGNKPGGGVRCSDSKARRKRKENGEAKVWVDAKRPGNERKWCVLMGARRESQGARDGWSEVGLGWTQPREAFIGARDLREVLQLA